MQLKVLGLLTKGSIIVTGDTKQRIYKRNPTSYIKLGLDFQGRRNKTLVENFRSTNQIMKLANSIKFTDEVFNNENIKYVRNGEKPEIKYYENFSAQMDDLVRSIKEIHSLENKATISIITREEHQMRQGIQSPVKSALERHFVVSNIHNYRTKFNQGEERQIFLTDVCSAKGLEFDYVFVLSFDRLHYPNVKTIENLDRYGDKDSNDYKKDIENIINQEKRLLYVALTRARK